MNQADWISLFIIAALLGGLWLIGGLTFVSYWQKRQARLRGLKRDAQGKKLYFKKRED